MLPKNIKIKTCISIILPFVLYGCETGSLTLREEHRLRVFEKPPDYNNEMEKRREKSIEGIKLISKINVLQRSI